MRQIVKTIDAYRFDELDDSAKENAVRIISDKLANCDWWEVRMEEQKEWLEKEAGLHNAEISFSLAYVQGDFCNIKCSNVDVKKLMELVDPNKEIVDWESVDICIKFHGDGQFSMYTDDVYAIDDATFGKLNRKIEDWLYCVEQDCYKEYMDEWEDLTSEESIADLCECNDYEFTEDGELI